MESFLASLAVAADIIGIIAGVIGIALGVQALKDVWSNRGYEDGGKDNQIESEKSEQIGDGSDVDRTRSDDSDR